MAVHTLGKVKAWLADTAQQKPFKRDVWGWVLVVLNMLAVLNAMFFFFGMLRCNVVEWLMLNTCAPVVMLFVLGFLFGRPVLMVAAAMLMFRYGTLGLFVFGWDAGSIMSQVGHSLMTLAVIYVAVDVIRHKRWKALWTGLLLGVGILVPFMILQTMWCHAHPEIVDMLFSGEWVLPE